MNTTRRLWLGFGILIAILVLTVTGVTIWLRDLRDNLARIATRGEPALQAAYEMQVRNNSVGLGVLAYLHTAAPAYRDSVLNDSKNFREAFTTYERLAPDQSELVSRVGEVFGAYQLLGVQLMDRSEEQGQLNAALSGDLSALLADVDARLATHLEQRADREKLAAVVGIRKSVSATGVWLGHYRRTLDPEDRRRLADAGREARTWLAKLSVLKLTEAEAASVAELTALVDATLRKVDAAAVGVDEEQDDLQRFFYLRGQLDTLLAEGALAAANADLAAASGAASGVLQSILASALALLVAGVAVSIITGLLASRGIVRTEQTLRVTLSSIGDAVIATDARGCVTFVNRVAEELTGWTQSEAVKHDLATVFRAVEESSRVPIDDLAQQVIRGGVPLPPRSDTVLISRDGTERPIDESAAPILDDQGSIAGVVLVFRDASQRRRTEQALLEADRRKDEFVAMLAHELHNPLAPLRNGLYILKTPGVDAATRDRVQAMMVRQVENMTRMIDDLLDVSRITRGKIALRKEPIDLGPLVSRVAELHRPAFEAAHRTLSVSVAAQPLRVDADITRMEQVVGNLLNNALKFTHEGGQVWLTADAGADAVGGSDAGAQIEVRVRDDGIGIGPDQLPEIFDLFVQVDRSMARTQSGLGIGLTLVRNLVEMHGGTVTAHSPGIGHGTEMVVRLPCLEEAAAEAGGPLRDLAPTPAVPPAVDGDRLRVLVVDDNADSAESLAVLLSLRGHEVHTAHDGPTAVSLARRLSPRLVLLDIGLPGIDGYEVARRLRDTCERADMVLIAVTGYGRPEDVRRSHESGFDHHLVKPVDLGTLQDLLMRPEIGVSI